MIPKKYRLKEREVKKVLTRGKPFFSYGIVLNYLKNNLEKNRFAIVIGGKSVKTNIDRNFFRRRFYDLISELKLLKDSSVNEKKVDGIDYVFVVKKQTKLNRKDDDTIKSFKKDIKFLSNKIGNNSR